VIIGRKEKEGITMKAKNLLIVVIAFLAVFCAIKMTTIKSFAKVPFVVEEETVAEEASEVSEEIEEEIASEIIKDNEEDIIIEETSEEEISEEETSEEEISEEEVIVDLDEEISEEENKKGLLPVPEEEDNKEAKGYIPTSEEVKSDVAKIVVDHAGDKPNSANTTDEGKTAFCIEEENFHPDHTDYIEDQEAEIDCSKYDNAVVEYTISLQEGVDKTMADEALQSALWSINGSETDHEAVLRDNHGQAGVDLYNRYKNAALHEGWSVAYRVLKPVEEHRHGDYQVLITFEATKEPEQEIIPPTPQPPVPPQPEPEVDTEITPAVPETGDGNFNPMWMISILGVMAVVAGVATSKKRA
jgi:hypothetical protein